MSGTHFYLTLPSNAFLEIFPDNQTTEYRVKLPQPVELDGNWEVGLYSIFYPNTWYTLRDINADTHLLTRLQALTIWQIFPYPGIRRKRYNYRREGRFSTGRSLRDRSGYIYIDLHVLQHHSAADRWRYECAITSKHSRRRKVWRYHYEDVYQHTIRACSNEILRRRENSFKE